MNQMKLSEKIAWAINGLLILGIITFTIWAFPYILSAYHLGQGRRALEEAEPARPDPQQPRKLKTLAFEHLQKAVRWDEDNTAATKLLPQAARDVLPIYAEQEQWSEVQNACKKILAHAPESQLARYYRARAHEEAGEMEQATALYRELQYFELEEGGEPPAYLGELMMRLDCHDIWELEQIVNVVSYLVWQEQAQQANGLLDYLEQAHPGDPRWPFYRGELYHRQGKLEQAQDAYLQTLELDAEYAQAYLQLGMASDEASELDSGEANQRLSEPVLSNVEGAARWYAEYNALAPEDLLGLKRLTETCATLAEAGIEDESCRDAAALRKELEAKTDDRRIVAELLEVPVEDVELGPNLVENGGFEEWLIGEPQGWKWSDMFSKEPFNAAAFAGGADELLALQGKRTARVDGFWVQTKENKSPARAGFWRRDKIAVESGTPYIISFLYRTSGIAPGRWATVWVSGDPDVFWAHDYALPSKEKGWHHFVSVGWNHSDTQAAIRPLVRSFAPGCVKFDDVQLRVVRLQGTTVKANETRFWVTGSD
jgi:tetratricopeptide (TPR) repeat protein